jgi:hypothetical protein
MTHARVGLSNGGHSCLLRFRESLESGGVSWSNCHDAATKRSIARTPRLTTVPRDYGMTPVCGKAEKRCCGSRAARHRHAEISNRQPMKHKNTVSNARVKTCHTVERSIVFRQRRESSSYT